jgi:hypothetical protein
MTCVIVCKGYQLVKVRHPNLAALRDAREAFFVKKEMIGPIAGDESLKERFAYGRVGVGGMIRLNYKILPSDFHLE